MHLVLGTVIGPAAAIWDYLENANLFERAPRLETAVFLLQGRHDYNTPGELVQRYYDAVEARRGKRLIWFEESAHRPHLEETEKFSGVLIHEVLPLATTPDAISERQRAR